MFFEICIFLSFFLSSSLCKLKFKKKEKKIVFLKKNWKKKEKQKFLKNVIRKKKREKYRIENTFKTRQIKCYT